MFVTTLAQVRVGNSLSLTVTVKLQEAVLPPASVAVQVTVEGPLGNSDPEGGTQVIPVTEQRSVAVGRSKLTI